MVDSATVATRLGPAHKPLGARDDSREERDALSPGPARCDRTRRGVGHCPSDCSVMMVLWGSYARRRQPALAGRESTN